MIFYQPKATGDSGSGRNHRKLYQKTNGTFQKISNKKQKKNSAGNFSFAGSVIFSSFMGCGFITDFLNLSVQKRDENIGKSDERQIEKQLMLVVLLSLLSFVSRF